MRVGGWLGGGCVCWGASSRERGWVTGAQRPTDKQASTNAPPTLESSATPHQQHTHAPPTQEMFLGQLAAMLERRRLTSAAPDPLSSHPNQQQPAAASSTTSKPDGQSTTTTSTSSSSKKRGAERWPISITRLEAMAAARAVLPYRLTNSQERVLRDVLADMAGPGVMMRLLQGDVGCGKTVVALMAMMAAAGSGGWVGWGGVRGRGCRGGSRL